MTAVVLVVLGTFTSSAVAADLIEGTWNFQGGQVEVHRTTGSSFVGTVVQPTNFSGCPHPVGQQMWQINGSADSYSGLHTWFHDECKENPGGETTWTVYDTDPTNFIVHFCTNHPKNHKVETDANGNGINGTRCFDLLRAKPPAPAVGQTGASAASATTPSTIVLPSPKKCLSRRAFHIRLHSSRRDPLRKATVFLGKKRLKVIKVGKGKRTRFTSRVDLRGQTKQVVVLRVVGKTKKGKTVVTTRKYHTCTTKITKPKKKTKSKKKSKQASAAQMLLQVEISRTK
jgi:hypothetical protein